jgi:hypothetical protein
MRRVDPYLTDATRLYEIDVFHVIAVNGLHHIKKGLCWNSSRQSDAIWYSNFKLSDPIVPLPQLGQ